MNITVLALTDSGCEEACAKEIGRWIKAKPAVKANVVEVSCTPMDAALLCYRLQTARRVLIKVLELDNADALEGIQPDIAFLRQFISPEMTFKVEGEMLAMTVGGEEPEPPFVQPLIEAVGGWAHTQLGNKVSLSKPDVVLFASQTTERLHIGLDVAGRSLSRREWRIMLSRRSLKATVAAATVIYAGASTKDAILDPIADDGTLAIEAALLLSRTSPRKFAKDFSFQRFPALAGTDWKQWKAAQDGQTEELPTIAVYNDSLRDMKAVRMNAKLASADKLLHSTKIAVDWVDLKLEEGSVDCIITAPMPSGKSLPERKAERINDDLCNQSAYVLRRNGRMTCITEKPEEIIAPAQKHGLALQERRDVLMGMRRMTILSFRKGMRSVRSSAT